MTILSSPKDFADGAFCRLIEESSIIPHLHLVLVTNPRINIGIQNVDRNTRHNYDRRKKN
jgi:hypothetical protein